MSGVPDADQIRAARQRAGLTRAQLAALADCSLSMVANLEDGAIPKRSKVLDRIHEALVAVGAQGETT